MGVTIHYRGTLDDVDQIETLEDRVLDLVYSLGGRAQIWRSFADHDSSRVVRGLMIELEPGQDTFSLLFSPEGHLTPLFQIEEAEQAAFDEPPYCFVKTQFGSLQGHIAIVHLLDALRQQYCSNLYVSDEGEYFENRDVNRLAQKLTFLRSAISSMAEGLREYGLNEEAAEDPSILATCIERIAMLVQKKLIADPPLPNGPAQSNSAVDDWDESSLEEEVATMDKLRRRNDLRSERMTRRIAEATAAGMSADEAFDLAMQEEGFPIPRSESNEQNELDRSSEIYSHEEPWLESLSPHPFDESSERSHHNEHPAVQQAQAFLMAALGLAKSDSVKSSFLSILTRASMDMVGGIAQATYSDDNDITHRAIAITQLKRALSGHGFARGALFGLRSEEAITQERSTQLHDELKALLETIHQLAEKAWSTSSE